jgi:HlyD family secretion protein
MKRALRRPEFWLVALLVTIACIVGWVVSRGPTVTTVTASRRDIEQHVVASGRVWVEARVQVSAQLSGLVVAVGAGEGQHVKEGDLLLQIDDAEPRAGVAEAKAIVEQAMARVEQLERVGAIVTTEALKEAEANLQHAARDEQRSETLVASGVVAPAELENARQAFDLARAKKNAAEARQLASRPLGADSRLALTSLRQAQAQLTSATLRLAQTRLTAAKDAVVLSRLVEPGDVVQPGRTLLTLALDGEVQIVIEPDERNLATLRLGQPARASADAFPEHTFEAEVSYIAPSVDPQRGSVEVRLRVPRAPPTLKPDMTMSVDLTVATKKRALTLPTEAIRGLGSGKPWALVVEAGQTARRSVSLGIRGDGSTEVTSGLDEVTPVIVGDGQALDTGIRVRPRPEAR